VIRTTTWCYIGRSDATRLAALTSVVPFGDIADRVKREMNIGCCHVQDCGDRPGFARVIYCAESVRGYLISSSTLRPDTGDSTLSHLQTESRLTGSCFMRITEKLRLWSSEHCEDAHPALIRCSLSASSTKAWVAESTLKLCAYCSGEWSNSQKSELEIANGRCELENHTYASWGRQAPEFRKLRIFGGFVNNASDTLRHIRCIAPSTFGSGDGRDG